MLFLLNTTLLVGFIPSRAESKAWSERCAMDNRTFGRLKKNSIVKMITSNKNSILFFVILFLRSKLKMSHRTCKITRVAKIKLLNSIQLEYVRIYNR